MNGISVLSRAPIERGNFHVASTSLLGAVTAGNRSGSSRFQFEKIIYTAVKKLITIEPRHKSQAKY